MRSAIKWGNFAWTSNTLQKIFRAHRQIRSEFTFHKPRIMRLVSCHCAAALLRHHIWWTLGFWTYLQTTVPTVQPTSASNLTSGAICLVLYIFPCTELLSEYEESIDFVLHDKGGVFKHSPSLCHSLTSYARTLYVKFNRFQNYLAN